MIIPTIDVVTRFVCKFNFCSLRRQVAAINKLANVGLHFWDYGNAFLLEASRAGKRCLKISLYMYTIVLQ